MAFNSRHLLAAYDQHQRTKDRAGRTWLAPSVAAEFLQISEVTLREWQERCPWLGRAIETYPFNRGNGRPCDYFRLADLERIRRARARAVPVPKKAGFAHVVEAADRLGVSLPSVNRRRRQLRQPIPKAKGRDALGRACDRRYVSDRFLDAEEKRRSLGADECTIRQAASILGCNEETVRRLVRNGFLRAEIRNFPTKRLILPRMAVCNLKLNHPISRQARLLASSERASRAESLLLAHLADGDWHPIRPIIRSAIRVGIGRKAVYAAAGRIVGLERGFPKPRGRGALKRGPGHWRLAAGPTDPSAATGKLRRQKRADRGNPLEDAHPFRVVVTAFEPAAAQVLNGRQSDADAALTGTENAIVELVANRPMQGRAIATRLELSYDYCRQLLGKLVEKKKLTTSNHGYIKSQM